MKPTIFVPIAVRWMRRPRGAKHAPARRSNLGDTRAASGCAGLSQRWDRDQSLQRFWRAGSRLVPATPDMSGATMEVRRRVVRRVAPEIAAVPAFAIAAARARARYLRRREIQLVDGRNAMRIT